ncbi:MAG: DNA polymerase III subunit alpha [Planctomycetes bacterium]|nr:DNA polymerase III subunit alpha [Planctomycetota bacterium]
MAGSPFVHLHVHSHYSLLDGTARIPDLVARAAAFGMPALALTDHGNLYGAIEFYRAARDAGIRAILGIEVYVAPGSRFERKSTDRRAPPLHHLVLLARDLRGWQNLLQLATRSHLEGFYYKPRVDLDLLREHREGLIALSACLSGEVNKLAVAGDLRGAREAVERYAGIFGRENVYLEIQDAGLPDQRRLLEFIPGLAREARVGLVATNDVHYLTPEDARAHEVHLCISTGTTLADAGRLRMESDQFYFRSGAEMERIFARFPAAVAASADIASRCQVDLEVSAPHLPRFDPPDGGDATAFFHDLCESGCRARYPEMPPEVRSRLDHEMRVIERMGYVSYFLIVWDFIRYARERGIPVGPGRGSAAGSIVAYALGITDVDPLRYDLIFERFLNAERISLPDIDIDFCMERRDEVIAYVRERYGHDRVSQIITFGTMAARAVIRDVGRVLGVPLKEVDAIAKKVPERPGIKLEEALTEEPDLAKLCASRAEYTDLLGIARRLEGLNRHASTHAAGVLISDVPIVEVVPLQRTGQDVTTQFPMDVLESIGMLKMDFLGLKTLTVIDRALSLVRRTCGIDLDLDRAPLDDARTYALLSSGETRMVFQLESSGMRELIRRLRPDRFEDIVALLALYRPGPLGSGMHESFVRRKHGEEPVEYEHPLLEPILRETNGVILYQEQVMRIANRLAGFSMNEADNLRKAMGKKKPEILARFRDQFLRGAEANGVEPRIAEKIFGQIEYFAGYGFNKSHSTAYALLSYRTAYLKANHPAEFMAAVMSCDMDHTDKIALCAEECRRMGIAVRPPDLHSSGAAFEVVGGEIRHALAAVKNVGSKTVEAILEARERVGRFRSIYHLCEEVSPQALNKTALEALIKAGALDTFSRPRAQLAAVVEEALARGAERDRDRRMGQLALFSSLDPDGDVLADSYPNVPEWDEGERLRREKEALGLYLSGHPLARFDATIRRHATHTAADLEDAEPGIEVVVAGQVAAIRRTFTRRGDAMAFVRIEDATGSAEVIAFPEAYEAARAALVEDALVLVGARVDVRDEKRSLVGTRIVPIESADETLVDGIVLRVRSEQGDAEGRIYRIRQILEAFPGSSPVYVDIVRGDSRRACRLAVGDAFRVSPGSELLRELDAALGAENVSITRKTAETAEVV